MNQQMNLHQKHRNILENSNIKANPDFDIERIKFIENQLIQNWINLKESKHTRRIYAQTVRDFLSAIGVPLCLARSRHLSVYFDNNKHLSRSSRKSKRDFLSSLFKFLVNQKYLEENPFDEITIRAPDPLVKRILTMDEVKKIIAAAKEGRDRILITFIYITGLRVSEVCSLTFEHFKKDKNKYSFWVEGKGGKVRNIYIDKMIYEMVFSLKEGWVNSAFVFRSTKESGVSPRMNDSDPFPGLTPKGVEGIIKRAAIKAEVRLKFKDGSVATEVSPHFFRHSHAVHAIENGVALNILRDTLGHSSLATTDRYIRVSGKKSSSLCLTENVKKKNWLPS